MPGVMDDVTGVQETRQRPQAANVALSLLVFLLLILLLLPLLLLPSSYYLLRPKVPLPQAVGVPGQCPWCGGLHDGVHADPLSQPPCNLYFTCRRGQLVHLAVCPTGGCYDPRMQGCVERQRCTCAGQSLGRKSRLGWHVAQEEASASSPAASSPQFVRDSVEHLSALANTFLRSLLGAAAAPPSPRTSAITNQSINWVEVSALLDFKASNNDLYGALSNWTVPRMPPYQPYFYCDPSWYGVWCTPVTGGPITELAVKNDVNGSSFQPVWGNASASASSIPPSIANLTALTTLDLSQNGLWSGLAIGGLIGPIPSEIGNLKELVYLDLRYNALTGAIPDSLSKLGNLQGMYLSYNMLSGPIPPSLGTLVNLKSLYLKFNNFTSSIPDTFSLLTNLTDLDISYMPIDGSLPSGLSNLRSLTRLNLETLPFVSGPMPASFSNLTQLLRLKLQDTSLTGPLPDASFWASLKSLERLTLNNSGLSGTLPTSMRCNLTSLEIINANLTGPIPPSLVSSLCAMNDLNRFTISRTGVEGPFPINLTQCPTSLTYVILNNNQLTGTFPPLSAFTGALSSLDTLDLSNNGFNGSIPQQLLPRLTNLATLDLSNNMLSGAMPRLWSSNSWLASIRLQGNQLEGNISSVLGTLASLKKLENTLTVDVSGNRLTGQLPNTWGVNVNDLRIGGNFLEGPLPVPTSCEWLTTLEASGVGLSGPLPPNLLDTCFRLANLTLSDNSFSGPLPGLTNSSNSSLQLLVVKNNSFSGTIPPLLLNLPNLRFLDLSWNTLSGTLPALTQDNIVMLNFNASHNSLSGSLPDFVHLRALTALSLRSNLLSGELSEEFTPLNVKRLAVLDLAYNDLNSTIPVPYAFTNTSLTFLDLSHNDFSGEVPNNGTEGENVTFLMDHPQSVADNPELCGAAGYPPCPSGGLKWWEILLIVLGSLAVAVLLGGLVAWLVLRPGDQWKGVLMCFREFDPPLSTKQVLEAVEHFSEEHLLGHGGFGSVYRGTLPDGTEVAIKRLALGSSQGEEEFKAEVQLLGRLAHRNIVALLAAFVSSPPHKERLLVYEFMPGGSLDHILTRDMPPSSPYRRFEVRRKIAVDVARGLKYLHQDCNPGIIHRDMKPANVLLDDELMAHVADFGLATEADMTRTHMTDQGVLGTAGYVAPEYISLSRLSFKSDVYAYGVTIIQLMTGRKVTDDDVVEKGLQRWAGSGVSIIDRNLDVDEEQVPLVLGLIRVGLLCTSRIPIDRPSMAEVVELLDNLEGFVEAIGLGTGAATDAAAAASNGGKPMLKVLAASTQSSLTDRNVQATSSSSPTSN